MVYTELRGRVKTNRIDTTQILDQIRFGAPNDLTLCRAGLKAAIRAKREAGEEVGEALEGLFQTLSHI